MAVATIGTLTACGSDRPDPLLSLTGSAEPVETVADQRSRAVEIAARSDTLVTSTLYGETDSALLPGAIFAPSMCNGTRCTATESSRGLSLTLSLGSFVRNLEPTLDAHEAVLTKNGITLTDGRGGRYGPGYRQYGGWMDHAGFYVIAGVEQRGQVLGETVSAALRGTAAGGDFSGSRPSASATWRGVMTGTTATGGGILQGDASLTYDLASHTLDAGFTNIVDIDRSAAHVTSEASFAGVPVAADGTFQHGTTRNFVRGGFSGPGQEEAVGVFEQNDIVGAFGAKRQ